MTWCRETHFDQIDSFMHDLYSSQDSSALSLLTKFSYFTHNTMSVTLAEYFELHVIKRNDDDKDIV